MARIIAKYVGTSIIAGYFARKRAGRLTQGNPSAVLRKLLKKGKDTEYGRAYGFSEILKAPDLYKAFVDRVPLIDYGDWLAWLEQNGGYSSEQVKPLINQGWPGKIDMFCLSSGTTSGRTKYIPYSRQMARVNRKAAFDFFATYLAWDHTVAPLRSKTLYLSGSTKLERDVHGVLAGDMSGLTKYLAPKILDGILVLPKRDVSSLEPWSSRLNALVEVCLQHPEIGVISGIPIWQLTLLEALKEASGKPISEVLPNLRFLIHGGMSITPYRKKIEALVGDKVALLEIYAASETGITAYQMPGETGMRFYQGYDVFYEFEDEDGEIITSETIKPHRSYRLIVSSCSGLWRYRIGDCLVFEKTYPLTLSHVSRDKTTSAFDEKVTERELEDAMMGMSEPVADFSLGPDIHERRHVWFLMTREQKSDAWVKDLDSRLRASNQDYDDYRGDGRIGVPISVSVPQRAKYLELLGREEGGQRKFPRLLSPEEVTKALAVFGQGGA